MKTLISASVGAGLALSAGAAIGSPGPGDGGPLLDPRSVPKYVEPLVVPPAMPPAGVIRGRGRPADYYEIAVRQVRQQVLPPGLPATTVWAYGSANDPATFHSPGFTVEARHDRPVVVKWINGLVDSNGEFLPPILPVDQTLHWANPPGPRPDSRGTDPSPYLGPVPIVTHVHGAHAADDSDGYTEAWYLPDATNLGAYIRVGSWYERFREQFFERHGVAWAPGSATFRYENDQPAATIWYHDHALGMTRTNVYSGMAGFYLLRGGPDDNVRARPPRRGAPSYSTTSPLPGPAPRLGDAPGTPYYEIPIAIQDRSFHEDGSLFYPDSRAYFDGFAGPYAPITDIAPIWNPEFFAHTVMVNGRTWPYLEVEPRRYRLRLLNGCGSRFLILKVVDRDPDLRPAVAAAPFWQIGGDQGFLPAPAEQETILLGPGERADTIVDFTGLAPGTRLHLINEGPDEPFGGGEPGVEFDWADPWTTGQVMQFRVVPLRAPDRSAPPPALVLPRQAAPPAEDVVRRLSLNEEDSAVLPGVGPRAALLGLMDENGVPMPMEWEDEVTETPALGDTEVWEIHNFTMDAHPVHVHLVRFEVLDRTPLGDPIGGPTTVPAEPGERGYKDTVIAYPDQVTRIRATFDLAGRYVWHCHILEHEDNEMMRPFEVEGRE